MRTDSMHKAMLFQARLLSSLADGPIQAYRSILGSPVFPAARVAKVLLNDGPIDPKIFEGMGLSMVGVVTR